jgi:hypothetical protein
MDTLITDNISAVLTDLDKAKTRIRELEAALHLVNDRHGPILAAPVHDVVLSCLGLKVHPNGTGYGYASNN